MATKYAPVVKYPGSKWRLADWILAHLPPHESYLEPCFGSGAVFFSKPPSRIETINDRDGDVCNLFRVCREQPGRLAEVLALTPWSRQEQREAMVTPRTGEPVEDARRFLVRTWQSYGARSFWGTGWRHATGAKVAGAGGGPIVVTERWRVLPARVLAVAERLRHAQIECRPAVEVVARHAYPGCAIYVDPPYPLSTRGKTDSRFYQCEMSDAEHVALLDALDAHPGPVLLSGYRCALYDERLGRWQRVERVAMAEGGRRRVECLWLNGAAVAGLAARQLALPVAAE